MTPSTPKAHIVTHFRNWTVVVGIILLLFSLFLFFFIIPSQVPASRRAEISPRFYPQIGALFLGLLSLILLLQEWKKRKSREAEYPLKRWGRCEWQLLGLSVALLVCGWTVSLLGFYLLSPVILVGLYLWLGVRSWVKIMGIGIGSLLFIYFLFEKGLQVELPRGFFQ